MSGTETKNQSPLKVLGFAVRSGRIVFGCEQCCAALKQGRTRLVVMAEGISENTSKRLRDRCSFYGATLISAGCGADELGHALGRTGPVAAAGVTDFSLSTAVLKAFGSSIHNS